MLDTTTIHECDEFLSTCCATGSNEFAEEFCGGCNEWASFECPECNEERDYKWRTNVLKTADIFSWFQPRTVETRLVSVESATPKE